MNNSQLKKMREENERILNTMNIYMSKRKRYEELLKNPLVQEFLLLSDYKDFVPICEKQRIEMITPIGIKRIDSNYIYVDQGTYIKKGAYEAITFPDNPKADYRIYTDLETGESEKVLIGDVARFEKEYLVISIPGEYVTLGNTYHDIYYQLRRWFFRELLTKSQHEVVKSLMDTEVIERILTSSDAMALHLKNN